MYEINPHFIQCMYTYTNDLIILILGFLLRYFLRLLLCDRKNLFVVI